MAWYWAVVAVLVAPAIVRGAEPSAQATPDAVRQAAPAGLEPLLADVDRRYAERDAPGATEAMRAELERAEKLAPEAYEVLWRLARHYFWLADDPDQPDGDKSRLGKTAWEYGDRATRADPTRVEGWHFAAGGMGNYALGIGIFQALRKGIEGKFKERLSRAEQIDPKFQSGAIPTAWGRFWFKLPWPKYDARKSERALLAALKMNPENVRARVYLADLYEKEGHRKEAREQLEKAVAGEPGRYDAPEERRWQKVARGMLGR